MVVAGSAHSIAVGVGSLLNGSMLRNAILQHFFLSCHSLPVLPPRQPNQLYMAPEFLADESGGNHKVDVYSFAIAMWEMYAKQQPFAAASRSEAALKR